MNEKVLKTIKKLKIGEIPEDRELLLKPLISYIQSKVNEEEPVNLNFICTHNSRRSHLSQIWAQTAAYYFDLDRVNCYSGGTEATAMYPFVGITLEKQGFEILQLSQGLNPIYAIKYGNDKLPIVAFSKSYDNSFNPSNNFAAIMTCSSADENCPFIPGAEKRIPITYEDPKKFDNTPLKNDKYLERSLQIASEMFHVFSKIKVKKKKVKAQKQKL